MVLAAVFASIQYFFYGNYYVLFKVPCNQKELSCFQSLCDEEDPRCSLNAVDGMWSYSVYLVKQVSAPYNCNEAKCLIEFCKNEKSRCIHLECSQENKEILEIEDDCSTISS